MANGACLACRSNPNAVIHPCDADVCLFLRRLPMDYRQGTLARGVHILGLAYSHA